MRRITRITCLALSVLMVFTLLVGCSSNDKTAQQSTQQSTQSDTGIYTPGTYIGEGRGNNGTIKAEVTFDANSITNVTILEHTETAGLADPALERVPQQITAGQTLNVDAVSGATNTRNGILEAVKNCVEQAGGDVAALENAPGAQAKAQGQQIERETQLLVIGGGIAGLSTAINARVQGIEVLVIEKMPYAGGAANMTGALIMAGMSELQEEMGVTDSVDTIFNDMMTYGDNINYEPLTRLYAENQGAAVDWLIKTVGTEFEPNFSVFPEHTNDRALYPLGKKTGSLAGEIVAHYVDNGGELLLETKATELLMENGRVVGAIAENANGDTLTIRADVTLLASGGYGASPELRPSGKDSIVFYGATSSTGDGIVMAEEIGAATHFMEYIKSYPQGVKTMDGSPINDSGAYVTNGMGVPLASQSATLNNGGIYVNQNGERCMNENMDFVSIKKVTEKQEGAIVYLVLNQKGYDGWKGMLASITDETAEGWFESDSQPIYRRGATLEEAANKAGIDGTTLTATVDHFNEMVTNGTDADFGREEMSVALEDDGQWYIIEQRLRMATTLGGLKTSTNLEVLDTNDQVIPGLYACGEIVGGVHGSESMPSACVGWAVTSGKLAGDIIAEACKK